ncbi:MAG: hypothetical protein ACNA7O_04865 [Rhodobacterales bacterium]
MTSSKTTPVSVTKTDRPDPVRGQVPGTVTGPTPDPVDEALPIDEIDSDALQPTDPEVVTALDDDEGGADANDPETGRPYKNNDPGADAPAATRIGSAEDQ